MKKQYELMQKIVDEDISIAENLSREELEWVSESVILKQLYDNRWYRPENTDTYFVMMNRKSVPIQPGEQIFLNYGNRSNAYLMENYGFTLDDTNRQACITLRVVIGTNPKEKISSAPKLLPDQKILEDTENLDAQTEVLQVTCHPLSTPFLSYLRSVLMQNNYTGPGKDKLMVSCPKVVEFEVMVLQWAIDLLTLYGEENISQTTVDQDLQELRQMKPGPSMTAMMYSVQQKKVYLEALKLYQVAFSILNMMFEGKEPLTSASFKKFPDLEGTDTLEQIFERRMGVKQYFRLLKMSQ